MNNFFNFFRDILKEELGDQYCNYSLFKDKRIFSVEEKRDIVALRKKGKTLGEIRDFMKIPVRNIRIILKDRLGDEYLKYQQGYHAEKYQKVLTEEETLEILRIRESGKSLKEISQIIDSSVLMVKKVLLQMGDEYLKPITFRPKEAFTKQKIISYFNKWYYKFVRELKIDSSGIFKHLKKDALNVFLGMLKGWTCRLCKIKVIIPVFIPFLELKDSG